MGGGLEAREAGEWEWEWEGAGARWQAADGLCGAVLQCVFRWLGARALARAGASCRAWRRAAAAPALWRRLLLRRAPRLRVRHPHPHPPPGQCTRAAAIDSLSFDPTSEYLNYFILTIFNFRRRLLFQFIVFNFF